MKSATTTQQFPRKWAVTLRVLPFLFFFINAIDGLFVHLFFFLNVKNRPNSCYKTSGCLYCLEWQQHMSLPLHSGSSVKMGNVFSHTLRADRHLSAT